MLAKRRRPPGCSRKTAFYNAPDKLPRNPFKRDSAALPSMRSERGFQGDSRRAHLFRRQAAPACCASTGARAPEPTGLGSGKPWHPRQCLKCFICSRSQPHQLLPLAVPPDERAAIWDGPHIVAYWDGLPAPSSGRHAEGHALGAHVVIVFAPGRALEWKLISASSRSAPGETAVSGGRRTLAERTCCRWNSGSSKGFCIETK